MDGNVASAGTPLDAFARVAAALRTIVQEEQHEQDAEPADVVRLPGNRTGDFSVPVRNRMLDHCGSDHRPLVDLLLSLGPTLPARLHGTAGAGTGWETRRAPLVHQVVATRYLQPDVARWAVDAWAAALGLISERSVSSPTVQSAVTPSPSHGGHGGSQPPAASTVGRVGAGRGAQARWTPPSRAAATNPALSMQLNANKRGTATRALARPIANAPSWAGGPAAPRFGTGPRTRGAPTRPTVAGPGTLRASTSSPNFELFAVAMFVCILLFLAGPLSFVLNRRNREEGRLLQRARTAQPSATTTIGNAPDSLALSQPPVAVDSSTAVAAVASLVGPDSSGGQSTVSDAAELASRQRMLDRARDSALVYDAMLSTVTVTRLKEMGASGDYRVDTRVRSVDGSPSCSQVASALKGVRSSRERIEHGPGDTTFVLGSRIPARLDVGGHFAAGPLRGTTNGVRWTFTMQGRFTPNGFEAQSRVETWAILKWGSDQLCVTVTDLVGSRVDR
ncbi:MAG: hypothetical protein V4617_11490 [Gemmatimonadota bacterium]